MPHLQDLNHPCSDWLDHTKNKNTASIFFVWVLELNKQVKTRGPECVSREISFPVLVCLQLSTCLFSNLNVLRLLTEGFALEFSCYQWAGFSCHTLWVWIWTAYIYTRLIGLVYFHIRVLPKSSTLEQRYRTWTLLLKESEEIYIFWPPLFLYEALSLF